MFSWTTELSFREPFISQTVSVPCDGVDGAGVAEAGASDGAAWEAAAWEAGAGLDVAAELQPANTVAATNAPTTKGMALEPFTRCPPELTMCTICRIGVVRGARTSAGDSSSLGELVRWVDSRVHRNGSTRHIGVCPG